MALLSVVSSQAFAQPAYPSFPNIDIDFYFDDFFYPGTVDETTIDSMSGNNEIPDLDLPAGHIFGTNGWYTAVGVDGTYTVEDSRAWYNGSWLEYGDEAFGPGYNTGVTSDDSWFDEEGLFITADSTFIFGEYPFLATLDTGAEGYTPGFVLLRSGAGAYDPSPNQIDITTGFSARTGTWVARMIPPSFDGLAGTLKMNPGFWTYSSEFFLDERDSTAQGGNIYRNDDHNTVWSEMNFEFYSDDLELFETGVTWGNTYTSLRGGGASYDANPKIGLNTSQGYCAVLTDTSGWQTWDDEECYDVLSGKTFGPLFANYYIVIGQDSVASYIVAWDEDLYHNRPPASPDPDSLGLYADGVGFDVLYMSTITPVASYVPPRWMRTSFTTNLRNDGSSSATLTEDADILIDWFFYTPEVLSFTSEPGVWDLPGMISVIRDSLWAHNSGKDPEDQIWRVNNVEHGGDKLPVSKPMEVGSWSCVDQGGSLTPSYDLDFTIERYKRADTVFFAPETVIDIADSKFTRHTNLGVEIDVYHEKSVGSNQWTFFEEQDNEGWVYEIDVTEAPWSSDIEMKLEVTVFTYQLNYVNNQHVLEKCGDDDVDLTYYYLPSANLLSTSYIPTGGGGAKRAGSLVDAIHEAYPNPSRSEARLSFDLVDASQVVVDLYDLAGRRVKTLVDSRFGRGRHEPWVDLSDLASGVFIYRLRAGEFVDFGRLVIVK